MKAAITKGTVHANCPKCNQPYMGEFDADIETFKLTCVGCSHSGWYEYRWPDDLPQFEFKKCRHNSLRLKERFGGLNKAEFKRVHGFEPE